MNVQQITMPEGLEQEVFDGLTPAEKEVIVTAAQGNSIVTLVDAYIRVRGIPEAAAASVREVVQQVCEKALFYAIDRAELSDTDQFAALMDRAEKFITSAESAADAARTKEAKDAAA